MGREYSKISPSFWTGETGREMVAAGPDCVALSLYLMTGPHANMLGLYYLPIAYVCEDLGMTIEGASKALRRVCEGGFAGYDEASKTVFVPQMARWQVGESLSASDNRVKSIKKAVDSLPKSPFIKEFFEMYREAYHLGEAPQIQAPSKPLTKPLRSQEQEQEQEQEQDMGPEKPGLVTDPPSKKRSAQKSKSARFKPPTVDEVRGYCLERKNNVDPEQFVNFYQSKKWMVGKNKMADWKAAVRTWEKKANESNQGPSTPNQRRHQVGEFIEREAELAAERLGFSDSPVRENEKDLSAKVG